MSHTPKSTGSALRELLRAVAGLTSGLSSGIIGKPTAPGPVVDIRDGKGHDPRRRH
ncbi:hypothetical protein [Sphaerisporangium rhizosphaerae]|uniref:Uncharacterized protein n=1 Tax=Sphaerisporangium rhizosphaerae TaxID=2269375 RepID=A0ABW2P1M9_9ACTN